MDIFLLCGEVAGGSLEKLRCVCCFGLVFVVLLTKLAHSGGWEEFPPTAQ